MSLIYEYTTVPGSNDQTQIQNAINNLKVNDEGVIFIFKKFTTPFEVGCLKIPSNFVIIGNGNTLKQSDAAGNNPIFSIHEEKDIIIEGFNLNGNKNSKIKTFAYNLSSGIVVSKSENIELRNLTFEDFLNDSFNITESLNVVITNSKSKNNGGLYADPPLNFVGNFLNVIDSKNISVRNIEGENCHGNGILLVQGKNITIENSRIKDITTISGISAVACDNISVINSYFCDIKSCPIEFNGINEFLINNITIEYSNGFIGGGNDLPNFGVIISYNDHVLNPPNRISTNGVIQNLNGSSYKPSANYYDILISSGEKISLSNLNCPQGIYLNEFSNFGGCSNVTILNSKFASNSIIYLGSKILIDNCAFNYIELSASQEFFYPQNIWIRNSEMAIVNLFKCRDIQFENTTYLSLINQESTFYMLGNKKGLDLYYEAKQREDKEIEIELPNVLDMASVFQGIYFGTLAIDVSKNNDQFNQFFSEINYVRSQQPGSNWLTSNISSVGTLVPLVYSWRIENNKIFITLDTEYILRLTFKAGFDKLL